MRNFSKQGVSGHLYALGEPRTGHITANPKGTVNEKDDAATIKEVQRDLDQLSGTRRSWLLVAIVV